MFFIFREVFTHENGVSTYLVFRFERSQILLATLLLPKDDSTLSRQKKDKKDAEANWKSQNNLHVTVSSLIAAAVVWMSGLPTKLNPIILPLMASIKREQEEILQQKAAEALAELISRCVERKPSPNDKLIKNLCTIVCMDPCETPQAVTINSMEIVEYQDLLSFGRSFANGKTIVQSPASSEDRTKVEGFISRRGSELALKHLCEKFGSMLFDKLPRLWDYLTEVLKPEIHEGQISSDIQRTSLTVDSVKDPQILINNIQLGLSVLIQQTSLYQEIKNSFWLMLIFLFPASPLLFMFRLQEIPLHLKRAYGLVTRTDGYLSQM